jgi:hypothetical protein
VKCFRERRFASRAEIVFDVVRRGAGWRDAAEEIALPFRVDQCEGHRRQHLVAELEAVLPHRFAIGGVANHEDRDVRAQAVDQQLARRRRCPRRDHEQP